MYLVELNPTTGLVQIDGEFDGVRAVKEFRDVINDESLGVECFTAIALTIDYLTPIGYYTEEDRPFKAMEIATKGNRRAFAWPQEKIQICLKEYSILQYNPTIEEKRTLDFMLLSKLKEIKNQKNKISEFEPIEQATEENIEEIFIDNSDVKRLLADKDWKHFSKKEKKSLIRKANLRIIDPINEKRQESKSKKDEEKILLLFKQLETIKSLIENFNKVNEGKDIYGEGPVRNGYKLTRLEEKQLDENSFYHKHQ